MFLAVIVISIIIGYMLKGNLKNIDAAKIRDIYLVFMSIAIEAVMIMLIRKGYLVRGSITYIVNLIMYIILFIFIFRNKSNKWMLLMGIGFLLNALAIFSNGGAMPVSSVIVNRFNLTQNVTSEGLYVLLNANTRLPFLGDIIPLKYPKAYAASIGDMVEVIAIALFIITEMKSKKYKSNLTA